MDSIEDLMKNTPYDFRWARQTEWKSAILLVWKTFMAFEAREYTQEGIRGFFEFVSDDDIYRAFLKGTYQVLLALDGDRIIGVASIRNRNLLSLLFVDEEYHRQGVGRILVELLKAYLRDEMGEFLMTVKAAPYAVEFYKKCGFAATGPEQEKQGIRTTPMECFLK